MNKILIIVGAIAFSLLIFSAANFTNAAFFSGKDLITPDSSFSFLQTWKESIQTFFTFGLENKAKQYLHLADVRLNEYKNLLDKGKTDIAQKTLDKYEKQLSQAIDKIKELKDKNRDITDLSKKIGETVSKHLEVLQENLQKVPKQAKKGIENAIENSQKGLEKIVGEENKSRIANPASVNCENKGGIVNIRKDAQGNETGFCVFPNGSECEEWDFWRGECKKSENSALKKDETLGWKTYRNEKYGFEVKYPPDWYVEVTNSGDNIYLLKKDTAGKIIGRISIGPIILATTQTVFEPDGKPCQIKIIDFAGKKAKECVLSSVMGDAYYIRITQVGGTNWEDTNGIEYYISKDYTALVSIYQQILFTFKFIK